MDIGEHYREQQDMRELRKEQGMKFRKKPVVIEAFEWRATAPEILWPSWFMEATERGVIEIVQGIAMIHTLEGVMACHSGDWIIRGVKGELYPCKPDIFVQTYEQAL